MLSWGEFLNYFNFNNIFVANTPSGGVVGWNLMAFRNKSFNFVDFFKTFNLINEYYNTNKHSYGTEEFFIQNLLGLWSFAENKNLYSVESCKSIYNSQFSRCKPLDLYGEIYILSSNFNFFPCYSQPNKNFNFFPCYFQPDKNNCHILHWDNCTKPWTKIKIFLNFDFLVQRAACFYSLKKEFSKNDLQDIDGKLYEIKDLYKKYNQLIRENVLKSEFKTVDDNILQQIESKMAEIGFTENSFDKNIFLKKLYMHCRDNNIGELNIFRKILKSLDSNWRFCQYIEFSTYTKADFVWFSKASQNLSEEEFFSLFG